MYDIGKILIGIVIFIAAFTSPIWTNLLDTGSAHSPDIKYPENYKECVMDKEYMKSYHMDLLNEWRDKVVRENIRFLEKNGMVFKIDGKPAEMSLTKTCMKCHSDANDFCDQCHNYLDVAPYCWDCHIDKYEAPKEEAKLKHVCNHDKEIEVEEIKEAE